MIKFDFTSSLLLEEVSSAAGLFSDCNVSTFIPVRTYVASTLQKCRWVHGQSSKSSEFGGLDTGTGAFLEIRAT